MRDGDVDFLFVFQGFWGVEGMEILIFHGLEGGCGMEMLIFHWFFEAFWCAGGTDGDIDFKFVFYFLGWTRDVNIDFSMVFQGSWDA